MGNSSYLKPIETRLPNSDICLYRRLCVPAVNCCANRTVPGWRHHDPDCSFTQSDPLDIRPLGLGLALYCVVLDTTMYICT